MLKIVTQMLILEYLKATIRINNETDDVEIVNLFNFTLKYIVFNWCNNYLGDYPYCTFAKLQLAFHKRCRKVQNDEQVYT